LSENQKVKGNLKGTNKTLQTMEEIFDLEMVDESRTNNNNNNNNNSNNFVPHQAESSSNSSSNGKVLGILGTSLENSYSFENTYSLENTYQPRALSSLENLNTPYPRYHYSPPQESPNHTNSFLSQSLAEKKENNLPKRVDYHRVKTKYFNSLNLVPPNQLPASLPAQSVPMPISTERQQQQHASTFVAPHELFVTQSYTVWDKRRKRAHLPV